MIAAIGFFVTRQGNEPTVAPSAAATVDAAASQAALDASWQATQDYYAAFDRASQAASLEGVDVAATAWPAEVDSVTQWVQTLSTGARHQTGDSVVSLISQEFVPSKDPATAADPAYGKVTQNICLDTSGVDLVDNATGQSLRAPAPGKTEIITRSPATITVERTGGVWKVSNEDVDYEATC